MELCKVYCGTYCIRGGSCVGLFCLRSSVYRGHSLNFMLVYVFGNCSRDQSTLKNGFLVGILPHWMIRDAFQKLLFTNTFARRDIIDPPVGVLPDPLRM